MQLGRRPDGAKPSNARGRLNSTVQPEMGSPTSVASRELLVKQARRTLGHVRSGTMPLGDQIYEVPASKYVDPARWELEIERIFRRVPLVLGLAAELSDLNTYRALTVAGTPILVIRANDGVVRAFLNTCRHRGSRIVDDGHGTKRRFTCPYHAWTYSTEGKLVGVTDRSLFGELADDCAGLVELPCTERAGLIFSNVMPDVEPHFDEFLCGYDEMLGHLGLADSYLVGQQSIPGPGWKIVYDGYLDLYHIPYLHRESFGPDWCNRGIYDAWGPHQRVSPLDHRFLQLDGVPEEEWETDQLLGGLWTIFPNVSIASFDCDGPLYMVSQLFPGNGPYESVTTQSFLTKEPVDANRMSLIEQRMEFLLGVVRDEDYRTCEGIQQSLRSNPARSALFGRNEIGGQRFHQWVDALVEADDMSGYRDLLSEMTTTFPE